MEIEGLRIRAARRYFGDDIEMAAFTDSEENGRMIALPLVYKKAIPGVCFNSFCSLSAGAAQKLMDDLWDAGLRPSEGSGSEGALKATQEHLADMKKIAFDLLDTTKLRETKALLAIR